MGVELSFDNYHSTPFTANTSKDTTMKPAVLSKPSLCKIVFLLVV